MSNALRFMTTALAVLALTATGLAQDSSPGLGTAESTDWGTFVVDGDGKSLYLYVLDEDAEGGFACVDACTNNWIPLLADSVEALNLDGVDAALVGVRERADGTQQVTYGGWPVYRSRRDVEPGHVRGQGVGSQFYLLSTAGTAIVETLDQAAIEVSDDEFSALMAEGLTQFGRNCVACHGAEGQGGAGPRLAGMQALEDPLWIISTIINGRTHHGMPAFGSSLDDEQIAAIATYVRNSFGNEFGVAVPSQVADVR